MEETETVLRLIVLSIDLTKEAHQSRQKLIDDEYFLPENFLSELRDPVGEERSVSYLERGIIFVRAITKRQDSEISQVYWFV